MKAGCPKFLKKFTQSKSESIVPFIFGQHGEHSDSDRENFFCGIWLVGADYSRWLKNYKIKQITVLVMVGWVFIKSCERSKEGIWGYQNPIRWGGGQNSGYFVIK